MRLAEIRDALGAGGVVATVTGARGSTPRGIGAVMVITGTGTAGTLGGGAVEHRAGEIARDILAGNGPDHAEIDFPLGPALDQCCGGHMRVALARVGAGFAEPLELWAGGPVIADSGPRRPIYLYGAGHVGQAVVAALAPLDFAITWIDAQSGRMSAAPAGVEPIEAALPEAIAKTAPADATHLIMTHSHAVDLEIVTAVLSGPFTHCGLIGSATKRARFVTRLRERGVSDPAIARLSCPIGLPGLADKRPAAIAASVAAQMLMLAQTAHLREASA